MCAEPSIPAMFDKLISDYLFLHLPSDEYTRDAVEELLKGGLTVDELLNWTDYREDAVVMCVLARIVADRHEQQSL